MKIKRIKIYKKETPPETEKEENILFFWKWRIKNKVFEKIDPPWNRKRRKCFLLLQMKNEKLRFKKETPPEREKEKNILFFWIWRIKNKVLER